MTDVKRADIWVRVFYVTRFPWLVVKWMIQRVKDVAELWKCFMNAKKTEEKLQEMRRKRDELQLLVDKTEYLQQKGFVEGVEWVLRGDWK